MSTRWTQFLKRHAGKGYTREELSKMYRTALPVKKSSRTKSPKKSPRKSPKKGFTKEKCRQLVSKKIKINMDEYKSGRWSSPKQAIAVSYSQVQKKHPKCKKYLKRSASKK